MLCFTFISFLESLLKEKLSDGRDRVLFQYIVYAKKKWPEEWQSKLSSFNHKYFKTPYTDDVIENKKKDKQERHERQEKPAKQDKLDRRGE